MVIMNRVWETAGDALRRGEAGLNHLGELCTQYIEFY